MAGVKGKSGRKALHVTERAKFLADKYKLLEVFAELAANAGEKTADRVQAGKVVLAYAHGQPAQAVDVTSGGKPLLLLGSPV